MNEKRLTELPLFEGLDEESVRTIAKVAHELSVQEGAELVREGDYSYDLTIIDEGQAEVVHEGSVVATLGPGTCSVKRACCARTCATRRCARRRRCA
jgi:CRP-like cAMP-binding protein